MNAYELADELESTKNWMKDEGNWKAPTRTYSRVPFDAVNMLRQQADRIAELEKLNQFWFSREAKAKERIAELEKESQNLETSLKNALIFIDDVKERKPLTDIEVWDIQSRLEFLYGTLPVLEFAMAIEERHGIK